MPPPPGASTAPRAAGRTLFDNLKKSIAYTLSHIWPELAPVLLNLAFSFPLPLPGLVILTIDLLTEQGPAISFAYEKAESAVMQRPPRNLKRDRLISGPLLLYSYGFAAFGIIFTCLWAYFQVYVSHGIPVLALAWTAERAFFVGADDFVFTNTNGNLQTMTYPEQCDVYYESVSAWYATIILCQFWNVWACKTRLISIFEHGVLDNFVTLCKSIASQLLTPVDASTTPTPLKARLAPTRPSRSRRLFGARDRCARCICAIPQRHLPHAAAGRYHLAYPPRLCCVHHDVLRDVQGDRAAQPTRLVGTPHCVVVPAMSTRTLTLHVEVFVAVECNVEVQRRVHICQADKTREQPVIQRHLERE